MPERSEPCESYSGNQADARGQKALIPEAFSAQAGHCLRRGFLQMPTKTEISRLRWRCRRGMRELDTLLLAYVNNRYSDAEPAEQKAFRRLLTTTDPDIITLLTGRAQSDDEQLSYVIECLLERP